ncbi:MAG: AAA family ATPase [Roseiflexaceae bacterium]|jgi:predicted kinase
MTTNVLVINGLPGVGKTTAATAVAQRLNWPLMTKDMFKESLFDSLGWSDRAWSRQLSRASMDLLFLWLERELVAQRACVIESNFECLRDTPRFMSLKSAYAVRFVQVHVVCDGPTLWQRHQLRGQDGSRHPGHQEGAVALELRNRLLLGREDPLELPGTYVQLDTTDLQKIDYDDVYRAIQKGFVDG